MSDDCERNAWDVARRAIDEVLSAFLEATQELEGDDRPLFLTDWTVVMSGHVENGDGSSASAYNRLARDEQAPHVTLGLLDYHRESLRVALFSDDD